MTFPIHILAGVRRHRTLLVTIVCVALLYAFYISGLSHNPPGFYVDESGSAYNAYLIATTGKSEFGISFPLFFQFYTESFIEYSNSPHIYLLALMYLFVPPSVLSARILAGTTVFIATILLGTLATRMSGRRSVGMIVSLTAIGTPWLFEVSRLVWDIFIYPICLVLFLLCLYSAKEREKWTFRDHAFLGISLALLTYSYTIGRLFGPLMAMGLIIFAVNRRALLNVFKTWVAYGITLLPLAIFYLGNPEAISKRFKSVTYLGYDKSLLQNIGEFLQSYFLDISPRFLLFAGDPLLRHHVPGTGGILAATFVLAIVGLILVLVLHRNDPWWRFVLYGLVVSVVPGALTAHRYHFSRLIALPIFLLVLTVPALVLLFGEKRKESATDDGMSNRNFDWSRIAGFAVLGVVLTLTLYQAVAFQMLFRDIAPHRGYVFDEPYPFVLNEALAMPNRPIYLEDGFWGPGYIHAYWYGAIRGVDPSNFVHLTLTERGPTGSIVITSNSTCSACEIVTRRGNYLIYKTTETPGTIEPMPAVLEKPRGREAERTNTSSRIAVDANYPFGIAVDVQGNIYVADSGNARIQKLSPDGVVIATIGTAGTGYGELSEPRGIAVDATGNIYVADASNNKLLRFGSDGKFQKEWRGPSGGFYGPCDIAITPENQLYILDQGRGRVLRFDPGNETFIEWGTAGNEEGQFAGPTGIAYGAGLVFVMDAANNRIQVFDPGGNFVRQWAVPVWDRYLWHYPDAIFDDRSNRLYVSSGWSNEVLVFDIDGNVLEGGFKPQGDDALYNPSSLCITKTDKGRLLLVLDTNGAKIVILDLESKPKK